MSEFYRMGIRSKQILSVLREHGPLSMSVIAQVLDPPMQPRRCREVVQRLREKGVIRRFNSYLPEKTANFYSLRRTKIERKLIAAALDIPDDEFESCFVRGAEIKHGEQCALWAEHLKKLYPAALTVRDWELRKHPALQVMLGDSRDNRDLLPDVLVSLPRQGSLEPVLIAVEVERTKKEAGRLKEKVKALAMQTQLDGVLFICADFEVGEALREAFASAELRNSRRIGRYAEDFLLLSSFDALAGKIGPRFVNVRLEERNLDEWLEALRSFPARERHSELFGKPA